MADGLDGCRYDEFKRFSRAFCSASSVFERTETNRKMCWLLFAEKSLRVKDFNSVESVMREE
jgi:hypothetical protein